MSDKYKTISEFGARPISTHAWSGDGNHLAISMNNKEVQVLKKGSVAGNWDNVATLNQHDLVVRGIDWAPKTNRIVTCSEDRNAYVWNLQDDGTWKQSLVLLRINRAATCVKWSPEENKFAVGSGARIVSVCYFEDQMDWWVAKHIKKPIRSTITTIDWHPNNCLLATGSSGFKVRVYSGYVKEVEEKPSVTPWGSKMPFQNMMAEFSNSPHGGGWIHSVSFSSDGNRLAWVAHDSSISVADATNGDAPNFKVYRLATNELPFLSCIWLSLNTLVTAGHGCKPLAYNVDDSGIISFMSEIDIMKSESGGKNAGAKAISIFHSLDKHGKNYKVTKLNTIHQKQISCIQILTGDKSKAEQISTSGGDGKVVVWNIKTIEEDVQALKI